METYKINQIILASVILVQLFYVYNLRKRLNMLEFKNQGISRGYRIPNVPCETIRKERLELSTIFKNNQSTILILISPNCTACGNIINYLKTLNSHQCRNITILIVGKTTESENYDKDFRDLFKLHTISIEDSFQKLKVNVYPFSFLIGKSGEVIKKMLLSKPQDMDKMISFVNDGSVSGEQNE